MSGYPASLSDWEKLFRMQGRLPKEKPHMNEFFFAGASKKEDYPAAIQGDAEWAERISSIVCFSLGAGDLSVFLITYKDLTQEVGTGEAMRGWESLGVFTNPVEANHTFFNTIRKYTGG